MQVEGGKRPGGPKGGAEGKEATVKTQSWGSGMSYPAQFVQNCYYYHYHYY